MKIQEIKRVVSLNQIIIRAESRLGEEDAQLFPNRETVTSQNGRQRI